MKNFSVSTKIFFAALFVLLVFITTKINFSKLVGTENQFFTVFQFFGPIAGGILGPLYGVLIVLAASFTNLMASVFIKEPFGTPILLLSILPLAAIAFFFGIRKDTFSFIFRIVSIVFFAYAGFALVVASILYYALYQVETFQSISLLRLFPMVFAAYYFGTRRKHLSIAIPLIAIALFIAHPEGRQVWYFTLFWTIPIIAHFFKQRLFIRSLGATFAAHSVGGAIWIWSVPSMTPELWIALIPVVIIERLLFASGISLSFVATTTLLARVESKVPFISIDKRYILSKQIYKYF